MAARGGAERGASRAVLIYNLYRLGLLLLCIGLGYIAGFRGLVLIAIALLVSGVLSWFALRRQREAMGEVVERTVSRSQARFAARTAAEDEYVDRMLGGTESTSGASTQPDEAATTTGDQPPS